MRITNVARVKNDVYQVTFTPNWFEELLGYGPKKRLYVNTGRAYLSGGGYILMDENGDDVDNGSSVHEAINRFRKKETFDLNTKSAWASINQ